MTGDDHRERLVRQVHAYQEAQQQVEELLGLSHILAGRKLPVRSVKEQARLAMAEAARDAASRAITELLGHGQAG